MNKKCIRDLTRLILDQGYRFPCASLAPYIKPRSLAQQIYNNTKHLPTYRQFITTKTEEYIQTLTPLLEDAEAELEELYYQRGMPIDHFTLEAFYLERGFILPSRTVIKFAKGMDRDYAARECRLKGIVPFRDFRKIMMQEYLDTLPKQNTPEDLLQEVT